MYIQRGGSLGSCSAWGDKWLLPWTKGLSGGSYGPNSILKSFVKISYGNLVQSPVLQFLFCLTWLSIFLISSLNCSLFCRKKHHQSDLVFHKYTQSYKVELVSKIPQFQKKFSKQRKILKFTVNKSYLSPMVHRADPSNNIYIFMDW